MHSTGSIFFLHIPKTAGTSVRALIEDNVPAGDVLAAMRIRELHAASPFIDDHEIRDARLIFGHLPMGIAARMVAPVRVITFLRNPIRLAISSFYHYQKLGVISAEETIDSFIETADAVHLSNIQTRWLADENIPGMPASRCRLTKISKWEQQALVAAATSADAYDRAVARLEKCFCFGIVERYAESITEICRLFSWSPPARLEARNKGVYSESVDLPTLRRLARLNRFDLQLYRRGVSLFEQRKGALPTCGKEPIRDRAFADIGDVPVSLGWHGREYWPEWGFFRWTTGEASLRLSCVLKPYSSYVFKCLILSVAGKSDPSDLQVLINGNELTCTWIRDGDIFRLHALIPPSSVPHAAIEVAIRVPCAGRHSDLCPGSLDHRVLGAAVKWIYVGSAHYEPV